MFRRVVGVAVVGLAVVAARAADTPVTVKVREPQAGDRVRVTEEEKSSTASVFSVKEQRKETGEKKARTAVYVEEVLVGAERGTKKPVKAKRTYEKHETTRGGQTEKGPLDGKTVLIEKQGAKYAFAYEDGRPVDAPAAADLDREFNRAGTQLRPADLLPPGPVKPGDTWEPDRAALLKDLAASTGMEFDAARATLTGKLVKAYPKDGKQFGVVEVRLEAPVRSVTGKAAVTVKEGSTLSVQVTADVCIDGTETAGVVVNRSTFKLDGSTMGLDLKVTAESEHTSKREPLKK